MSYSNAVALQMPSSYVLMSNEEMEYLEGGTFYGVNISANTCTEWADGLSVHANILGVISAVLGIAAWKVPGAAVYCGGASLYFGVCGTVIGLSASWFSKAAKNGGAHLGYDSSKKKIVYGYGKY